MRYAVCMTDHLNSPNLPENDRTMSIYTWFYVIIKHGGSSYACYTNHPTLRDSLIGRARNWDGLSGLAHGHGQVIRSELYRHDGRHWMLSLGCMLPGLEGQFGEFLHAFV